MPRFVCHPCTIMTARGEDNPNCKCDKGIVKGTVRLGDHRFINNASPALNQPVVPAMEDRSFLRAK